MKAPLLVCVSSTGEDFEAWFDRREYLANHHAILDALQGMMVWDRRHPAQVETWPEYLADLRRTYGWSA